jgi:hypothetical protein
MHRRATTPLSVPTTIVLFGAWTAATTTPTCSRIHVCACALQLKASRHRAAKRIEGLGKGRLFILSLGGVPDLHHNRYRINVGEAQQYLHACAGGIKRVQLQTVDSENGGFGHVDL